jgi:hypothetical protein
MQRFTAAGGGSMQRFTADTSSSSAIHSDASENEGRVVAGAVAACFCFIHSLKSRTASLGTSTIVVTRGEVALTPTR